MTEHDPVLEPSEFDSALFDARFLRVIRPDAAAIEQALAAEDSEARLIVDAKITAEDKRSVADLVLLGFARVSTLLHLDWNDTGKRDLRRDTELLDTLALDGAAIDAHAAGFVFQRFRQDPRLPQASATALMAAWIENSLGGRRETAAIARNFCTFSEASDALVIDLLSCVDTGRGLAARLLASVQAIARERGLRSVHVTTEAENVAALRCYQRAGFCVFGAHVALHLVRNLGTGHDRAGY